MIDATSARPRVLRVTTTIEPEMGGPSHTMIAAAVAEQQAGVQVTVVSTVGHGPQARASIAPATQTLRAAGVTARAFSRPAWAGDWAMRWGYTGRYLLWLVTSARRFDVVHIDYVWSLSTVAALLGARLARRPVVLTPHESLTGFDLSDSRSPTRRVQKRIVRRLLLSSIRAVVVASEIERRDSGLDLAQSRVIPHPVQDDERAALAGGARASSEGRVVGFLGRLHPKKRVPLLLDAMELVPPPVRLRIGGGHPEAELARLRTAVADGSLAGRVDFAGFIEPSARDAFFASIDLLAMPSDYECFGMVAAEAMGAGLPVVVSDHCGIATLVQEYGAGAVVPTSDPTSLATAIATLTTDDARAAAASQAATRCVAERLTFSAYAGAMVALYDEVRA